MPRITIDGRELDVLPQRKIKLGILKHAWEPWRQRTQDAKSLSEAADSNIEGLLFYLGHNMGVDRAWLEAHADSETLADVMVAAGAVAQPGEARPPARSTSVEPMDGSTGGSSTAPAGPSPISTN